MKKSPFQFGLKGLFVAITPTALLPAGLLATDPGIQLVAIVAILWFVWAAIMIVCAYAFSATTTSYRNSGWARAPGTLRSCITERVRPRVSEEATQKWY
jgi:hypothetical protein